MTQAEELMAVGFDLEQLDVVSEEVLHKVAVITDIDGNDKSGFFISSKNSPEYQAASHAARIDGLKRTSKRKSVLDTSTDAGAEAVAKIIERNEIAMACAVVKGWFGFQTAGAEAPFNKETVAKMFAKFPTWKDKVTAALDNEANFLKG